MFLNQKGIVAQQPNPSMKKETKKKNIETSC